MVQGDNTFVVSETLTVSLIIDDYSKKPTVSSTNECNFDQSLTVVYHQIYFEFISQNCLCLKYVILAFVTPQLRFVC